MLGARVLLGRGMEHRFGGWRCARDDFSLNW